MRIESHAGTPPRRRMNITSLVDVVFLLLIFFMVTTTFRTEVKLFEIDLPRAENPSLASMGETIVVTIMADGTFFVGEEKVAKADLRGKLKAAKKVSGIIMVRGDKTADFQDIMRVVDIAKDLGIEKIVFMTEKKSLPFTDSGE